MCRSTSSKQLQSHVCAICVKLKSLLRIHLHFVSSKTAAHRKALKKAFYKQASIAHVSADELQRAHSLVAGDDLQNGHVHTPADELQDVHVPAEELRHTHALTNE